MDEQELYRRAIACYYKHCHRYGCVPQEPLRAKSEVSVSGTAWQTVVLANEHGRLATYAIRGNGKRGMIRSEPHHTITSDLSR